MDKLWLDLEMSGDIDDAVTLIFALENRMNIAAVSLLNPTEEELSFTKYWLDRFDSDAILAVHRDTRVKNTNQTHKIIKDYQFKTYPVITIDEVKDSEDYTVIGGGAYTIPNLLRKKGFGYFILQGGYAGPNLCPTPVLDKFRNKRECASWNPNLDLRSTNEMLSDANIRIDFISKDICHDSDIDLQFVGKLQSGETKNFLIKYFGNSGKNKKMHDLVALTHAANKSFVSMTPAKMTEKQGKWKSSFSEGSNKRISTNWNKEAFLDILLGTSLIKAI